MRWIDVQVSCPNLSSWQGMRRTRHRNATRTPGILAGDGAEMPLLRLDLLTQLSSGAKGRRISNSKGDCLILTDDGLDKFDAERMAEVRAALSCEFRVDPYGPEDRPAGRRMGLKHMVFAIVIGTLALIVGITIGSVL